MRITVVGVSLVLRLPAVLSGRYMAVRWLGVRVSHALHCVWPLIRAHIPD